MFNLLGAVRRALHAPISDGFCVLNKDLAGRLPVVCFPLDYWSSSKNLGWGDLGGFKGRLKIQSRCHQILTTSIKYRNNTAQHATQPNDL